MFWSINRLLGSGEASVIFSHTYHRICFTNWWKGFKWTPISVGHNTCAGPGSGTTLLRGNARWNGRSRRNEPCRDSCTKSMCQRPFGNNTVEVDGAKWHRLWSQGWHLDLNLKPRLILMVHICNPRTLEVDVWGLEVWVQTECHTELYLNKQIYKQ